MDPSWDLYHFVFSGALRFRILGFFTPQGVHPSTPKRFDLGSDPTWGSWPFPRFGFSLGSRPTKMYKSCVGTITGKGGQPQSMLMNKSITKKTCLAMGCLKIMRDINNFKSTLVGREKNCHDQCKVQLINVSYASTFQISQHLVPKKNWVQPHLA